MPIKRQKAIALILENGGRYVRSGGEHDIYLLPDGRTFALPRHGGELKPGIERQLLKRLGLRKGNL